MSVLLRKTLRIQARRLLVVVVSSLAAATVIASLGDASGAAQASPRVMTRAHAGRAAESWRLLRSFPVEQPGPGPGPSTYGVTGLACDGVGACMLTLGGTLTSAQSYVFYVRNGRWKTATKSTSPSGFWFSAAFCGRRYCRAQGGSSGYELLGNKLRSTPRLDIRAESEACLSPKRCFVTAEPSEIFASGPRGWAAETLPAPTQGFDPSYVTSTFIACARGSWCLALLALSYNDAVFSTYTHGSWSPWQSQPLDLTPDGLSCPAPRHCVTFGTIGQNGGADVYYFDSGGWFAPPAKDRVGPTPETLTALSCASTSFCVAGDRYGRIYTLEGGHWRRGPQLAKPPFQISEVSCPSTSFCVVASSMGALQTVSPSGKISYPRVTEKSGVFLLARK